MNYKSIAGSLFAAFLFSILFPAVSVSDQFHYKNLLIGERPAGMAGAYTAVSDTPEGAFYNPAGMAYAVGKSLSVSVNAYHNTWTKYEGVLGGGDWDRESSSLVPNFFGMIQPLGKGKIAFSYAVPDIIEEDQNQRFANIQGKFLIESFDINLSNLDKTYKFGPSYARKINDSLAVGFTLYLHYRQNKQIVTQYVKRAGPLEYEWSNRNFKMTESGIEPKLGVMWTPADKLSLGLTVSKNNIFQSKSRDQWTYKSDILFDANGVGGVDLADSKENYSLNNTNSPVTTRSSYKQDYPLTVSLGGAWFKSESLMLSCDIDYYEEVSSENREAVLNFAIGTEYYLSEKYALRGGFYTNMANTPEVKSNVLYQNDNVDIYGITGSVSRFTRSSAMTLGLNYAYGAGDAQPVDGSTGIYDATINALTVFLSGSFNY